MNDTLRALNQSELLALALEASRRSDSGHAMAYLKEAATRADASAQALFLLGSEYAQVGMFAEAADHMAHALAVAPDLAIARFQLGMLHLTSGQPELAQAVWAPLAGLQDNHPQAAYLKLFHNGMENLIADRFDEALAALSAGVEVNLENQALNGDMRKVIDAIQNLPGNEPAAAPATLLPMAPASVPGEAEALAKAASVDEEGLEPSHLFINAYTHRGKPH